MKLCLTSSLLLAILVLTEAFCPQPVTRLTTLLSRRFEQTVPLEPELEGGEELNPLSSMPGCRMKKMEELTDVKKGSLEGGTPYKFWMTAEVEASLTKEIRTQILKDASKKANFPGFRKGQVPPYAQPQITQFAVQESVIKTVQAAVDSFGLIALEGSDGQVEVLEDVEAIGKGYKTGDTIKFTATVNARFDPEKFPSDSEQESDAASSTAAAATTVVDVESEA